MTGKSKLPDGLIEAKRAEHNQRRRLGPGQLEELFDLLAMADAVVSVQEALELRTSRPARTIALRHDIDHDLEMAVRFAELEYEAGYRASYYALHTDWYYRAEPEAPLSSYLLDALETIAGLGHEVALHNNVIVAGLVQGRKPTDILVQELEELGAAGFEPVGTVAHGDPLCHKLGFINSEIFTECPRPRLGAPDRTIAPDEGDPLAKTLHPVALAPRPMTEYGLSYEANFVGHSIYLSDTGGVWHQPIEAVKERFGADGGFLQILAHPVWWGLRGEEIKPVERKQL